MFLMKLFVSRDFVTAHRAQLADSHGHRSGMQSNIVSILHTSMCICYLHMKVLLCCNFVLGNQSGVWVDK